jgi:hypothetical protein
MKFNQLFLAILRRSYSLSSFESISYFFGSTDAFVSAIISLIGLLVILAIELFLVGLALFSLLTIYKLTDSDAPFYCPTGAGVLLTTLFCALLVPELLRG